MFRAESKADRRLSAPNCERNHDSRDDTERDQPGGKYMATLPKAKHGKAQRPDRDPFYTAHMVGE